MASFADMLGDLRVGEDENTTPMSWRTGTDSDSDWTIIVDDRVYHVHKGRLKHGRRTSVYFKAQFELHDGNSPAETDLSGLLHDLCKGAPFESALDFLYDNRVHQLVIGASTAIPLLEIAQALDIPTLRAEVWEKLKGGILNEASAPILLAHTIVLAREYEVVTKVRAATTAIMAAHFDRYSAEEIAALPDTVATASAILNHEKLAASPAKKSHCIAMVVRKCYDEIDATQLAVLVKNAQGEGDVAPEDALLLMAKAHHVMPQNGAYAEVCAAVVAAKFEELTRDDLHRLPHEALCQILRRTELSVSSEDVVFDAIRAYVGTAELDRAQVSAAWETCRFAFLSCEKIAEATQIREIPRDALVGGLAMRTYRWEKHALGEGDAGVQAFMPRCRFGTEFTYMSDFDENGILYHLGTNGGTTAWANPADAGIIAVTRSSDEGGTANMAAGRSNEASYTRNTPGGWYMFDLGATRSVMPNHYTVQHGCNHGGHCLRNWVLEGSADSVTWTTLKTHANDTSIPPGAFGTKSWPIADGDGGAFRYLRIRSTGVDSIGHHYVMFGGFEVYGKLVITGNA